MLGLYKVVYIVGERITWNISMAFGDLPNNVLPQGFYKLLSKKGLSCGLNDFHMLYQMAI